MIPSIKAGSVIAAAGIASAHTFESELAGHLTVALLIGVLGSGLWTVIFKDLAETRRYKREMKR